jgi:hypothetical protein
MSFKKTIVLFAGGDILQLQEMTNWKRVQLFRKLKDKGWIFAVEAPMIQIRIKELFDLDTEIIYLPSKFDWREFDFQLPKTFSIGCYLPSTRKTTYQHPIIMEAVKKFPEINFHFYCTLGYEISERDLIVPNAIYHTGAISDIPNFLKDISCGIRMPLNDTYSMSAIEYNLAGRWFITNQAMPFCDQLPQEPTSLELIEKIEEVRQRKHLNQEGKSFYSSYHTKEVFIKRLEELF